MRLAIVAGSASAGLANEVARACEADLERACVERFPDGEIGVAIGAVRGADLYVVQSAAPPIHEALVELLLLADAARRAGATRITAVVPYLAYARQDRRSADGESVGGRVVADLLSAHADRVVCVDLHAPALEGFFACPVEHLSAVPLLADAVRPLVRDAVVVAPDLGAAKRAQTFARLLDLDLASIRKRRVSGTEVEVLAVDGDVRGRAVLIVDDMISTAATIAAAWGALRSAGALRAIVVATHGLFVPPAIERIRRLGIELLVVSDTVRLPPALSEEARVVSVASLLAEAIGRLHREVPLAELVAERT